MYSILLQNEAAVVADKPHGWLTTPAREESDRRKVLGRELQAALGIQIYPVHRLDFEVSGLVLFAKTKEAHRAMQAWFEHRHILKTYEALSAETTTRTVGEWREWRSQLARGKKRAFEAPHGKEALTRARVTLTENHVTRWELMPLTGRAHQLRFEMAKNRSPILGDTLYGGPVWTGHPEGAIALRAVKLDLTKIENRFGLPEAIEATRL